MSCGVGCRHGSDPLLLLLWHRLLAAALIQPLAWELPYASDAALKRQKTKDKKKKKKKIPSHFVKCKVLKTLFLYHQVINMVDNKQHPL